jgi:hypothetical protein
MEKTLIAADVVPTVENPDPVVWSTPRPGRPETMDIQFLPSNSTSNIAPLPTF